MPSPFPGMDPYLESPARWRGVHVNLISKLMATLNGRLPQGFVAEIDERVYVVQSDRDIYPDITVVEERNHARKRGRKSAGVAVLESDPPYVVVHHPIEVHEPFIDIRRTEEPGDVVATVEVLSPTNKNPRSPGYSLYREKQQEILASRIHLIEIDLLHRGHYTVAVRKEDLDARGPWHYVVSLHRGGQGDRFETWPFTIRECLPCIRIPLAEGVPDEVVDLQEVLQRCYDECGYARLIDYREDPAIPLAPADARWANALLREKGYRPRRRKNPRKGGRS